MQESTTNRLHAALALLAVWLAGTSPWVSMLRRLPANAGFLDFAHVALGALALVIGLVYASSLLGRGRWRQYVPGRAAGITGVIEGLLLIALIATGVTGATWFLLQGSADALAWRDGHVYCARALIGVGIAHGIAVASHLLEF